MTLIAGTTRGALQGYATAIKQRRKLGAATRKKVKKHRGGGCGSEVGPSVSRQQACLRVSHLENLEKRLLHSFSADISGDANVLQLARYLAAGWKRGEWTCRADKRKKLIVQPRG